MKLFKHYLVVIAISLVPFINILFNPQMPHTHDGPVHLARIAAYYKALGDGQILPRWAGDLNFGYGMPLFNFMYHLPYLIASVSVFFSLGLVNAFKLTLLISFILSGVGMFMFARKFFKNIHQAYLVTILYQFAPFHLVELVVRGSIGEAYTYSFLPFVLLGILYIFEKPSYKLILITALATSLLILSHNAISLVSFALAIFFILWFAPNHKGRFSSLISLALGLSLTAFYWLPAVLERKYTYGDLFMRTMYQEHFPPIQNFFIPNFINSVKLQTGGINVYIGLVQILGLLASAYLLISKTTQTAINRSVIIFGFTLILLSIFFMQPVSTRIWEAIPALRMFQFPWRFLAVTGVGTAFLGSILIPRKKFQTIVTITLCITSVFSTTFYWRPPLGYDNVNEAQFWNYPLNTTYFGETDLIWSEGPAKSYPKLTVELIDGKGEISELSKKSILHLYTVNAQTPVRVLDHTQYFPGWRVYLDGSKIPIEFQDQNYRGLITFSVPEGSHRVKVIFGNSKIRVLANLLTIFTIILLLFLLLPKILKKIII